MNRRQFIRDAARHAATVAVPAVAATAAAGADLYHHLERQLEAAVRALETTVQSLDAQLGGLSDRLRRVELQQQLLWCLLIISLLIDGGTTWALFHLPLAPAA